MLEMCNGCYPDCPAHSCPYFHPSHAYKKCDICGEWIYPEEQYIENDTGHTIHYDCVDDLAELLDWLGYKVCYMDYPE